MRVSQPCVLAINHDAGGANALVPVIRYLRRWGLAEVTVVAGPFAAQIFRQRHVPFHPASAFGAEPATQAEMLLEAFSTDVVLSGASWGETVEKFVWDAAKARGIRSLAVLDMWSMYWQRFGNVGTGARNTHLPTRIAVMDEAARSAMRAEGFSPTQVIVTGQPHFDYVRRQRCALASAAVAWRHALQLPRGAFLVLFASESHSVDLGQDNACAHYLGYTERDVLAQLIAVLGSLGNTSLRTVALVVKLHPKETVAPTELASTRFPVHVVKNGNALTMSLGADVVVGMTSMFLVEAAILGRPALSFQPIDPARDTMWTNRSGLTRGVYTAEDLRSALFELLASPRARFQVPDSHSVVDEHAARRVAEALLAEAQNND